MAGLLGATTSRELNKLQYAMANVASDISTVATGDLFVVADVSADYEIKYATAAQIGAVRTAVTTDDAATYTVLAANSGKTHIIPNLTATCTFTLPTAAAGLEYLFIGKAVATDAQDWKFSAGVAYLGAVQFLDTDDPADTVTAGVFPNGTTNDNLTIVTPAGGTWVRFVCDGTNWIVNGISFSATTPAFADS